MATTTSTDRSQSWDPAALPDEAWPADVAFLPYVGRRYKEGWGAHRVLLLGESHYREDGMTDSPEDTRPFARSHFEGMQQAARTPGQGIFFSALDRLLANSGTPTAAAAAEAWERVAFVNLSQVLAGTASNHRPKIRDMKSGADVLIRSILPILKPTVILVLGRFTWDKLPHGTHVTDIAPFQAMDIHRHARRAHVEMREVWSLDYEGGSAWMTWVYHPSRHIDTWKDRAGALRHLLGLPLPSADRLMDDAGSEQTKPVPAA